MSYLLRLAIDGIHHPSEHIANSEDRSLGCPVEFASDILLIVDDSSLRKTLNFMLSDHLKSPVPAVAGAAAMQEVIRRRPRLVFIQDDLRGGDGIQLGVAILKARQSTVVLIARNELRAVDAYEAGIADFLLTPLRRERLLAALSRGLQRTPLPRGSSWIGSPQPSRPLLRFKSKRGFVFVRDAEILWISAAANYLEIHCAGGTHRVRGTMAETSERLKEYRQFLRIHRSILINADYVREVRASRIGDCVVVLHDFRELPVSRKHVMDEWILSTRNVSSELSLKDGLRVNEERSADRDSGQHGSVEIRSILVHPGLLRTC
jgi:two-component system LytT family response regulator